MIGSAPPLRGISSYCLELARSVAKSVPVEFISFRFMYPRFLYPGGDLRDDETFPAVESPRLNIQRVLTWYNPLGWIMTAVRIKSDVVHVQHWSLPLVPVLLVILLVLRTRRLPVVLTIHNVLPHERGRLHAWGTRLLCHLADACILHSEENVQMAETYLRVPKNKIECIAHGVLSFFNDGGGNRHEARKRLGIPGDVPVVLCFGAVRSYKGIDVLLRSFSTVLRRLPHAILVVAGQLWVDWAPYRELIEQEGIDESVRTFLKYIDSADVKHFFLASDLAVLPYTHFDAQSGVGMAALAFATPMIVTTVGALPELVKDPRCRVPPNDVESLAERIVMGLTDEGFRRDATADAEEIAKTSSWDCIAQETVALYDKLAQP
jgi:glycosyltransferase involved in cell wall biosynthesis